ncbi:MAG: hypothetical protein HY747_09305 [Elusimicrobia bacterium]|nr:hypothetical protein [Elusimicrobiota bacterium]
MNNSSRRRFLKYAGLTILTFLMRPFFSLRKLWAREKADPNNLEVNLARIASKMTQDGFVIFNIDNDNLAILNEAGVAVWGDIAAGVRNISVLIDNHMSRSSANRDIASYQVIVFLDELRAHGFINFHLSKEREVAPLLDISLTSASGVAAITQVRPIPIPIPRPPPVPPKPPFGKSRSSCKTACV